MVCIALHDVVYIIMAWKRHLVTLGTFIFAQLKLIYECHSAYSHRTYKPLQNDSFVATSEFGWWVAATAWQLSNLAFWAETINMPSFVEDDEQNDKRRGPQKRMKSLFCNSENDSYTWKSSLTLEKQTQSDDRGADPPYRTDFSVLSKTEKSKMIEQIK